MDVVPAGPQGDPLSGQSAGLDGMRGSLTSACELPGIVGSLLCAHICADAPSFSQAHRGARICKRLRTNRLEGKTLSALIF